MTVNDIETARDLVDEMEASGQQVGSVWRYTNKMNGKTTYAVFAASQWCDIDESPNVVNPTRIWAHGEWL